MRFLQVSGVRIGADPESEKSWGRQRAGEFKASLQHVLNRAEEEGCDLLLIAGGLFCHQPVTAELAEVNRMFLSVPALSVVIAPGREDPLCRNAPARSFHWAPNVFFAAEDGLCRFYFPKLGTSVYAAGYCGGSELGLHELKRIYEEGCGKEEKAAARILLLPAVSETERRDQALLSDALAPFSYAAVGGAQYEELLAGKAVCAGVLEPVSMAETGGHGFCIGDISAVTGRLIGVRFEQAAKAAYIPLLVNVTEATTEEALLQDLKEEMERRGSQNIYRIRICGSRRPGAAFDLSPLQRRFRIAELVEETVPDYDLSALFSEHPQDMIGFYISRLRRQAEEGQLSAIQKKAMAYGIDALLKTAEGER